MYDLCMLSDLAAAVEELEVPLQGEAIGEVFHLIDRLQAKAAAVVGEYEAQGLAVLDGATSTTGLLKQHGVPRAAAVVRTARRVRQLPVTLRAWIDGTLTGGHIDAICANVDDATIDQLQEHEADLVPVLAPLSVHDAAVAMRLWKAHADALIKDAPSGDQERTAHLSELLDGRGRLDADLDAEGFALAQAALRLAASPDAEGEERSARRRRGDALVDVFRFFLDHHGSTVKHRNRPHLNAVIDWDRFERGHGGELAGGAPLSPATVRRLLCDADVHRVVTTGRSVILDYGTTARLFSDAQFNALVLRDRHCRHPGCDRPPWWCEAHHVIPDEAGGSTDLANGVLKCTRHHHIGHLPGWTEKLEPDGTYHLTAPDGRSWVTTPPGVLTSLGV